MVNKVRTLDTKIESVNSVSKDKVMDVEIKSTSKPLTFTNIRETVDQYEQYLTERENCTTHRIILTLASYCSNVLFNPLTEIVYHEGSTDDIDVVTEEEKEVKGNGGVFYGKKSTSRLYMIDNTEYSSSEIGYKYHPGYDFFNNHILRNKSFKIVNPTNKTNDDKFNTIEDIQRRPNKTDVKFVGRITSRDNIVNGTKDKHLYNAEDILSYIDSINANLVEENGWFGFVNNSGIDARLEDKSKADSMGISRVLNDRHRCEFIDMYPDRTLFSFVPKYNKYQHRLEYNWDIWITYPYKNFHNHELVENGLKIAEVKKVSGFNGRDVLVIRTYTKHNLSQGDTLYLYYSSNKKYTQSKAAINVTNVGNLDGDDTEHFFYTTDVTLVLDALGGAYWYDEHGNWLKTDIQINNAFKAMNFTLKRVYNGKVSDYYFRIFRKIPNFRCAATKLTKEIGMNKEAFERFIADNTVLDFNHEYYKLAFANNIYTDEMAQTVFTDDIDIDNLTDNLGRPLTEIYITVVKTNRGYKEWYSEQKFSDKNVEFSHCFNTVVSGVDFGMSTNTYKDDTWIEKRRTSGDITVITLTTDNKFDGALEVDITNDCNEFYGDIVEFNAYECREYILDPVQHRFNTVQRDTGELFGEKEIYHTEITSDDYDKDGFKVLTEPIPGGDVKRPEGYFYQPHYRIPLKSLGNILQDFHGDIKVRLAQPASTIDGMMIQVKTRLPHHLATGDHFYICDPTDGEWIETTVYAAIDKVTFQFSPFVKTKDGSYHKKLENWVRLCDILNADNEVKRYKLRKRNMAIPNYAVKVGDNAFLWRPVLSVGDTESTGLPEYVFANGRFYIHRPINLFLKRQDPHGYNKLYAKDSTPNDIFGTKVDISRETYKEEGFATC